MTMERIEMSLARGALTSALRSVKEDQPLTWEFSAFSQNGEDGILDVLTRQVVSPNHYFIEIGAGDGIENNTAFLAIARKYEGIMVEADPRSFESIGRYVLPLNIGVEGLQLFVNLNNLHRITDMALYQDPDVLSLDIDGNDLHIMEALLNSGLRPKIIVVEYNSAFGPEQSLTIRYDENFSINFQDDKEYLYYGASVSAWKNMLKRHGYHFVTVERRGVNAFFVHPSAFPPRFLRKVKGLSFAENFFQMRKYRTGWRQQFEWIKDKDFVRI